MERRLFWNRCVRNLEELNAAAVELAQLLPAEGVICLRGEMGAGKTTFTSALCRALGVVDAVSSPTFAIVNEYRGPNHGRVFHLDCYRLESVGEALAIGCEDYFDTPGAICIVEWPDVVEPILPAQRLEVAINVAEEARHFKAYVVDQ